MPITEAEVAQAGRRRAGHLSGTPDCGHPAEEIGERALGQRHNCGLFAVSSRNGRSDVVPAVIRGLSALQHRGQLAAGLAGFAPGVWRTPLWLIKGNGLVGDVLGGDRVRPVGEATTAIGHVRYATFGSDSPEFAQPFLYEDPRNDITFAFCFAGNLTNATDIADEVRRSGGRLTFGSDAETLAGYLGLLAARRPRMTLERRFQALQDRCDGALNCLYLDSHGRLAAYRDRHGFRPLHYTETASGTLKVASEDCALAERGAVVRSIEPGELLIASPDQAVRTVPLASSDVRHCFFEFVYFSHPASHFGNRGILGVREALGRALAEEEARRPRPVDVVVGVPESSTIAASAYAAALGVPYRQGIVHDRYAGRTFIERDAAGRAQNKYRVVRDVFEGKRVHLVDDSVVRGTTLRAIVGRIREHATPAELHVRIACPPIVAPCYYGIDIPAGSQLLAAGRPAGRPRLSEEGVCLQSIAERIGVDSLAFLPLDALVGAIGIRPSALCLACATGSYPTASGQRLYEDQASRGMRDGMVVRELAG